MPGIKPSGGPDHTLTREEVLRARNEDAKKVKRSIQETRKRNKNRPRRRAARD